MPEIQEFIFKITKSKETLKLIDYLKSLDKFKPVKTSNGEKKVYLFDLEIKIKILEYCSVFGKMIKSH